MPMSPDRLVSGNKYRVRYKSSTQRVDREMVAVFLGKDTAGDLAFSGRPEFGTTSLPLSWYIDAQPIQVSAKRSSCYADKKVTNLPGLLEQPDRIAYIVQQVYAANPDISPHRLNKIVRLAIALAT